MIEEYAGVNIGPKKNEAIEGWTNLHNDELRRLYSNETYYEDQNEKK